MLVKVHNTLFNLDHKKEFYKYKEMKIYFLLCLNKGVNLAQYIRHRNLPVILLNKYNSILLINILLNKSNETYRVEQASVLTYSWDVLA